MKTKYLFLIISLIIISPKVLAHEDCNQTIVNTTYNNLTTENNACNVALTLETDKLSFKNGEKIEIYNKLINKTKDFSIEYWIEGLNSTIIKEKLETKNTNKKQFTPKLKESTTLLIKNNLTYIDCNNTNNNTYNTLSVFVEVEKDPNQYFNIEKLYLKRSKKIELGSNLTSTIKAYTGNFSNLTIISYIENITNKTSITIQNYFNETTFNITTSIPNDCNITTGNYFLAVESQNNQLKEEFIIVNNCKETTKTEEISNATKGETIITEENSDESVINLEVSPVTGNLVYESSSQKARRLANYLGFAILAAITIAVLLTSKNTQESITESTKEWSSQLEQQLKS